jgi:outer membrane protein assembly factor BamE (lipoprotein component of BamABCDE complex)
MRLFLILATLCLLTSCTSYENKGYSFSYEDYKFIKTGLTKKNYIRQKMGEPNLFDGNSWIYFGEKTKKYLFFRSRAITRKIILVEFDNDHIVSYFEEFDLNSKKSIAFNQDQTIGNIEDKSFFIKILKGTFSNIGKISPN